MKYVFGEKIAFLSCAHFAFRVMKSLCACFRHHGACLNSGGVFFFFVNLVEDHLSGASIFACPPMHAYGEIHRKEILPLLARANLGA